jgi:hypothetical protein
MWTESTIENWGWEERVGVMYDSNFEEPAFEVCGFAIIFPYKIGRGIDLIFL